MNPFLPHTLSKSYIEVVIYLAASKFASELPGK